MTDFRTDFTDKIKNLLEEKNYIHTAWEGGSAATGRLDEYSDLDLCLICDDDKVEKTFEIIADYLQKNYGIKSRFRLPEPAWHGHSQCFYDLDNTPEFFFLDLLVEKLSAGNRFMEKDRHGDAIVWFDKKNLFDPTPTPGEQIEAKGRRMFKLLSGSLWLHFLNLKKEIRRGNLIDSYTTYYQLLNRLSILWNLKYRPAKVDFGLRYAQRDFPPEIVHWLEEMLIVSDLKQMKKNLEIIEQKFYELIDELHQQWG